MDDLETPNNDKFTRYSNITETVIMIYGTKHKWYKIVVKTLNQVYF